MGVLGTLGDEKKTGAMGKQLTEQELLRIGELNDSIVSGRLGATSEEKARARNELEVALHGNLEALVENARRGLRAGGLEKALSEMVEGVADEMGEPPGGWRWEEMVKEGQEALAHFRQASEAGKEEIGITGREI